MADTSLADTYLHALTPRRTIYDLSKENFPLSDAKVVDIVHKVIDQTPTVYNLQTNRALVFTGAKHDELWNDIVYEALKNVTPEAHWRDTRRKIAGFAAAYGTVLFFEDEDVIKKGKEEFPVHANKMDQWAAHSTGAASIHVWTALALEKVGANLQHFNPLIDHALEKAFDVPKNWRLTGQLVFGSIVSKSRDPHYHDPSAVRHVK